MRRLALFARPPIEGQVKRRLSPALPARLAAEVYSGLLADALDTLSRSRADERLVYWAGPPREVSVDVHSRSQAEGDLGERLTAAFDDLIFAPGDHALVLGSDVPGLDATHVDDAFAALDRHDIVLGPARDGGYWCIGLTWKDPELFRDIPWSTSQVLARTVERATETNRKVAFAQWLDDLDTPADLASLIGVTAAGRLACGPHAHVALEAVGCIPAWLGATSRPMAEAPSRSSP